MGLTVGEAHAVGTVISYLASEPRGLGFPVSTRAEAIDALAPLADAAVKRLLTGIPGAAARELLEHRMPGRISPTDPAELGAWLRDLPDGTILRGKKGLGWQLGWITVTRFLLDPVAYRALTTMSGEAFEISEGHSDLDKLAHAGTFTVLALGDETPGDGAR